MIHNGDHPLHLSKNPTENDKGLDTVLLTADHH